MKCLAHLALLAPSPEPDDCVSFCSAFVCEDLHRGRQPVARKPIFTGTLLPAGVLAASPAQPAACLLAQTR